MRNGGIYKYAAIREQGPLHLLQRRVRPPNLFSLAGVEDSCCLFC